MGRHCLSVNRSDPLLILPPCQPFALRLVALPAAAGADPADRQAETTVLNGLVSGASIQDAEVLPPVSSFSPERNVVDSLRLIRADGPVKETLACFQMLAQLMKLPFRRDSIEKVLQDNLRRGLTPNLQLCGQLAASLGLHVMASRVPSVSGHPPSGALHAALAGGLCSGGCQQ